jgi:hypothetical protein
MLIVWQPDVDLAGLFASFLATAELSRVRCMRKQRLLPPSTMATFSGRFAKSCYSPGD